MAVNRAAMALALAALGQAGCILGYANTVAAPGQVVPAANAGTRNGSLQLHYARNVSAGAHADTDGAAADTGTVVTGWPGLDFAWRHGLTDGLALELRVPTSLLFPLPVFPIPNGLSLAPVWRVRPGTVEIYTSPRALLSRGSVTTSGPATLGGGGGTISEKTTASAWGLELPASFVVRRGRFAASLTPYVRAFVVGSKFEKSNTHTNEFQSGEGGWATWGGGATLALELVFTYFRLALAAGVEAGGNPGAALGGCAPDATGGCEPVAAVFLVPQGGLTLSFGRE